MNLTILDLTLNTSFVELKRQSIVARLAFLKSSIDLLKSQLLRTQLSFNPAQLSLPQ